MLRPPCGQNVSGCRTNYSRAPAEVNVLLRKLCFARIPALLLLLVFSAIGRVNAQSDAEPLSPILGEEILSPQVATFELKEYILRHVANPPSASSAAQWTTEAKRLREHLLNDIAFHGWPQEWVNSPPKFEDLGVFATEKGYRLRKLRYEIVPGFQSTAILYEPENMQRKIPGDDRSMTIGSIRSDWQGRELRFNGYQSAKRCRWVGRAGRYGDGHPTRLLLKQSLLAGRQHRNLRDASRQPRHD